jgi:ABC-2 type transport system ATP-binding protein
VALCAAFSTNADLLLLDEPTSGLDPLMEAVFQECVKEAQARGATVLLSSHILEEVAALCDQLSIVRSGKIVMTGKIHELLSVAKVTVNATTKQVVDYDGWTGVHDIVQTEQASGHRISLKSDPKSLPKVLGQLVSAGLVSVTVEPPSLDDVFLAQYRDEKPSAGERVK